MKKILLIDGIYPINTRNTRIINSLIKKYKVKFCAWNRENITYTDTKNYIFSSNEGYGNKIKKIFGMKNYLKFIKSKIREYNPDIVVASQWDMLLLVILSGYKGKIIYENIDLPSSNYKFLTWILLLLEKLLLKKVDGIVFASRFFSDLYINYSKNKLILENLPLKEIDLEQNIELEKREKLRISFIGGLRYFEVMKNLLLSIQEIEKVEIYLIGKGAESKKFQDFIANQKLKNIFLIGSYNYKEIKKFYVNSDLVWAVYPNEDYNVKFAISNKFHESLLFTKPCFFAEKTLLGNLVAREQIGIIVNPYDIKDIKQKINELNPNKILKLEKNIQNYKKNKKLFWEDIQSNLLKFIQNVEGN